MRGSKGTGGCDPNAITACPVGPVQTSWICACLMRAHGCVQLSFFARSSVEFRHFRPVCLSLLSLPSFSRPPFPSPRPHVLFPWSAKGSPMQGLTALSSVLVWALFFASHIHAATVTPSQNYLPQVTYSLCPFFASLRLIFFFHPTTRSRDSSLTGTPRVRVFRYP